jgi:hypothetical protein
MDSAATQSGASILTDPGRELSNKSGTEATGPSTPCLLWFWASKT